MPLPTATAAEEGPALTRRHPGWYRRLATLLALLPALCVLGGQDVRAGDGYSLGHGWDVGRFNIAGYSNLLMNLPEGGSKSLVLDDLSLFVTGHVSRLVNPFVEAELTDFDIVRSGDADPGRGDGDLLLERLYNSSYLTDSLTLKLGKMLAPVGEWNEIHAAPLVLTTVRPAVTHRNFSEYVTGVAMQYTDPDARLPDVQVYWQPAGELSERPSDLTTHEYETVEGLHVGFPTGLLDKIGFSFQQTRDDAGADQSLFGLDFHYTSGRLTLQGEGTFSAINNPPSVNDRDTEWGSYVAASYSLTETWSVHAWYEGFEDRTAPGPAHDVLIGVSYRPHPAIVGRVEYLQNLNGNDVNPTGVFASWSVLF